ncbi:MAG: von Willebrand factor type A domain-containing protein [Lentisphaeraceae bacterium]|nr:von Willebrand factor type A domain-containing protein [Lentisphaeraceae bacterium]
MNTEEKLTAYALGELHGAEKEAFEKELNESPELQSEVEAIREFTGELEAEFKKEESLSLEGSQREKILQASKEKKFKLLPILISAAAACLVVGYLVLPEIGSTEVDAAKIDREIKQAKSDPAITEQVLDNTEVSEKTKSYTVRKGDSISIIERPAGANKPEKKNEISFTSEDAPVRDQALKGLAEEGLESNDLDRVGSRNRILKARKEIMNSGMAVAPISPVPVEGNTERYGQYLENTFGLVNESPLTTFSIDVDTASYTNLRRKLLDGYFPHKDAVRIEEMINYFDYDYPQPEVGRPFSVNTEVAASPWTEGNKLVRIGLQGKEVKVEKRPSSNLVFLIDVSGSMSSSDKLPLLKEGFQKMVSQLNEKDRVAIVVYAGNAGVVLEPTICDQRGRDLVIGALGRLNSGGSTNGAGGINEAYRLVQKNFIQGGTNRVILATDGDFNVGVSHDQGLIGLVQEKAKEKAYLTVLAFGQGNLNDRMMEEISNKGNGNYFYIDSAKEGTKVLCEKISSTLVTIAKDVKIQVEFNPALVHSYRLIGYDNRKLKNEDFNDDKKDAGEIGAGHNVTAIYEIVPVGSANARPKVDGLKYQPKKVEEPVKEVNEFTDELLTVKLRYKSPEGGPSTLIKHPVKNKNAKFNDASKDFIFSSSVAAFGMLLKSSEYCGDATFSDVEKWIANNKATKSDEEREELLSLVRKAVRMKQGQ